MEGGWKTPSATTRQKSPVLIGLSLSRSTDHRDRNNDLLTGLFGSY